MLEGLKQRLGVKPSPKKHGVIHKPALADRSEAHKCKLPGAYNTGDNIDRSIKWGKEKRYPLNTIWRCRCGKAWVVVPDFGSSLEWRRYPEEDLTDE